MKKLAALTLSMFLVSGIAFADTPKDADPQPAKAQPAKPKAAKKPDKSDAAIAAQLEELRQALQSQQEQLQMLKEELAKRDRQIDEAREAAAAANARATEASTKATEAVNSTAEVKTEAVTLNSTVSDLKASNEILKTTVAKEAADAQKDMEEGPMTIRYKGVNFTPGGFVAAETVFRTRATGDDINTQFTGIPYPSLAMGKVSENEFTARQSRMSMFADTKIGSAKVSGYFEGDFLGAAVTSNNRQSNSYVFRQRQFWASVKWDSGLNISGGQMWSLVTEDKKGIENRQEAFPMMIDPQYLVGWAWQRAYGFRVVQNWDKFAFGISVEGPQTTLTAHGAPTNYFIDIPGQNAGLFNGTDATGYTTNKAPDLLVKAALDPGWGHYEIVGILSPMRQRIYPCGALPIVTANLPASCTLVAGGPLSGSSVAGAYNNSIIGGGVGFTARLPIVAKKADLVGHFQGGSGIGRYSSAQLADVTVHPDGTLVGIKNAAWLGMLELHPSPKLDLYAYGGGEYDARAAYTYPNPAAGAANGLPIPVGYGSPLFNNSGCSTETISTGPGAPGAGGTCTGDVRTVMEGTLGFWHNVYTGPKGRVRWGIQYSYLTKIGWAGNNFNTTTGVAGTSIGPKAVDNMVLTSFRYYLP